MMWWYTYFRAWIFGIFFLIETVFCSITGVMFGFMGRKDLATINQHLWASLALYLWGIEVEVIGEENVPAQNGAIVTFNHQSHIDILVIMRATQKHLRFGAKIELFKFPFFGAAMRATGCLPIARDNRSEVMKVYQEAIIKFKENFVFALAPEGTRQTQPQLGVFKKGPFKFAIEGQVPIVPAVICGAFDVLEKGSILVNLGKWKSKIYVKFLKPIPTVGLSQMDLDNLRNQTFAIMNEEFQRLAIARQV